MLFEFVPELLEDGERRHGRGVAQRAECIAQDVSRHLVHQIRVFASSQSFVKTVEQLFQPSGALAARHAPTAGLVRVEVHDALRHLHHAGCLVEDDDAARAEHRAGLAERVEVHGDVDFIGREQGRRRTARNHRLQPLVSSDTAADFIDHFPQGKSHRQFVDAGVRNVPAQAEEARPAVALAAEIGEPLAAVQEDVRHRGERLHIIHNRRASVEAHDGREGRFDARVAAISFQRIQQRRLFAALIGSGAGVGVKIKVEART